MGPVRGTVTKILGASSTVDCGPAGVFQCGLRARLSRKGGVRLAVGDRVLVTPGDVASGEAVAGAPVSGTIEEVDPRRTVLRRVRDLKREYVVCANVDRIFIVVAVSNPPYNRSFIDRLIVGVERDALSPVLVVNKIDLADRESRALVARDMGVYGALGYPALLVSAETGEGIDAVREAFRGRISAVVGPSGAGKSSLLNLVSPGASLVIGKVSEHDGRGRHTTTAAELLPVVDEPGGHGFVIDTPGLSEFGLGDIRADELIAGFRELARAAVECRFKNCGHRAEPGCAVRRDVESGAIDAERYASWLKLREEINS
jgi:ribosome biogenesis GTPase